MAVRHFDDERPLARELVFKYDRGAFRDQLVGDEHKADVRVRYSLADKDIDTVMKAVKVDGRWYLADYLEDAEASLPPPEPEAPAALAKEPKAPAGR